MPYGASDSKSNVDRVAALYGSSVRPGDLVLSTQPEQVPVLAYYMGYDHRFATPLGLVEDPHVMDWRDVLGELEAATPAANLEPLLTA